MKLLPRLPNQAPKWTDGSTLTKFNREREALTNFDQMAKAQADLEYEEWANQKQYTPPTKRGVKAKHDGPKRDTQLIMKELGFD